jgi:hypothetical protein
MSLIIYEKYDSICLQKKSNKDKKLLEYFKMSVKQNQRDALFIQFIKN